MTRPRLLRLTGPSFSETEAPDLEILTWPVLPRRTRFRKMKPNVISPFLGS